MSLLEIKDLQTWFFTKKGIAKAVNGISFSVFPGQILGIIGESGSGKSITNMSIMGLVPNPGKIVAGSINFDGLELVGLKENKYQKIRGNQISMIFQNPMSTLNPVYKVGTQMAEAVLSHRKATKSEIRDLSIKTLEMVGIPSPKERLESYPHQLSGGLNQRIVIAIALLNNPRLILADEPTTALDVTIQSQIIYETKSLVDKLGMGLIWVSHDLATVAGLCDQVCVMYAGKIMEKGTTREIISTPRHPYTLGLLDSDPSRNTKGRKLKQISGNAPSLLSMPDGCPFYERCPYKTEECRFLENLPERNFSSTHSAYCLHSGDING